MLEGNRSMKVSESVRYVGADDHDIDLFEGQFHVPLGMAYNSYVILDDKIAVMDSVDGRFGDAWLDESRITLSCTTWRWTIPQAYRSSPRHSPRR